MKVPDQLQLATNVTHDITLRPVSNGKYSETMSDLEQALGTANHTCIDWQDCLTLLRNKQGRLDLTTIDKGLISKA